MPDATETNCVTFGISFTPPYTSGAMISNDSASSYLCVPPHSVVSFLTRLAECQSHWIYGERRKPAYKRSYLCILPLGFVPGRRTVGLRGLLGLRGCLDEVLRLPIYVSATSVTVDFVAGIPIQWNVQT
jgi:hypothetical protein